MQVSIAKSLLVLCCALAIGVVRGANTPPAEKPAPTYPFTYDTLLADAKKRAAAPYSPQHNRCPPASCRSELSNTAAFASTRIQAFGVRAAPFRLPELLRAGYNPADAVTVSTV